MYYFTSDTHFCSEATLKSDGRRFKNAKQFDKYVLKIWNKQTTKDDTIFVVGDFVDCHGEKCDSWKIWTAQNCYKGRRKRGTTELLFCMLRAKHSYTNTVED